MNLHRRAYTFVEILVVIAIIGVLIALMLPAVQACREAARRMNCSNNIAQLIVAVQTYETHHRLYPPGTVNDTGPIRTLPSGYHHNWLIQLLPYMEEKNTYNHIDRRLSVYDPAHTPVRQMKLSRLMCPSQPNGESGFTDYAGVHNDVEKPIDVDNNGVFFLNSHIGYFDVKDGSSQTLFIGEKITYDWDLGWMSGTRATLRNAGSLFIVPPPNIPAPRSAPPDYEARGGFQPVGDEEFDNWALLTSRKMPKDRQLIVGGFGSYHPGGAQFALGDGSVQFLSATVDADVYKQMAHRADGQLMERMW